MNKKFLVLIGIGVIIACFLSYNFGRNSKIEDLIKDVKRDTVIKIKVDTLTIEKPIEKIRYKDRIIEVPVTDTLLIHKHDTTYIAMQSEKVLYENEEYKAVISGIQPKLESITVYPKTIYQNITEKQIVQKKWNFNATVGPGVLYNGEINYGIAVVVGFGYSF